MTTDHGRILVTGSSGTIGTRLCEALLDAGHDVTGADLKPNRWSRAIDDRTIRVDLQNASDLANALPGEVDTIIHLAANARVYNLVVDPSLARANFDTVFNTLEYARSANARRFMFASSREVYGNTSRLVHHEDESYVRHCESPYTASKIGGEAMVHSYQQCYGLDFLILRFSNVYGMYDDSDRVVPLFIRRCIEGLDLVAYGREKVLDFTYIDDAVDGLMRGVDRFDTVRNDVFNIASGQGTALVDLAHLVRERVDSDSRVIVDNNRPGEVARYVADITKAKRELGYCPGTGIDEGIGQAIEWSRAWLGDGRVVT